MNVPIISIVGLSGSGKTTLLEKLIPELQRRGCRLAVVKHHPESGLELDEPGKDTWRFSRAGADQVILAAPDQVMIRRSIRRELTLAELALTIQDVDLVLTEGYKSENAPKIEIVRGQHRQLVSRPGERVAVVSDRTLDLGVPQFDLEDAEGLADFIVHLLPSPPSGPADQ